MTSQGPVNPAMRRTRSRISIPKEDRIWDLRCQGYDYDSIARIVNTSEGTPGKVLRRVARRPPLEKDPIKRGRYRGFLSDNQINDIRMRKHLGETYLSIAKDFDMHESCIGRICRQETYANPCEDDTFSGYPYNFSNRLTAN
jgi:DNA-binding CsgD family transcriptional regulator